MNQRILGKQRDDLIGARQAHMRPLMRLQTGNVGSEQLDLAGCWKKIPGDLVEQRGFTRAIGADDQTPFSWHDLQIYILCRRQTAEKFLEIDNLQSRNRSTHD